MVSGLLNIDKPQGLTSHDVVARVRKITGQRKAGHTGTLDPMATGVLLVCLGQATRLIEYIMPGRKKYRATIHFGVSTDTLDADGQIVSRQDASTLTEDQLRAILPTFKGELNQYPPIFSAIKQGGQPLYKQARAGKPVQVEPRAVTIYALEWIEWQPPRLTIDIECSAGTYIRSLARDLGNAVGPGAHLTRLVRTANGAWSLAQAVTLDRLKSAAESRPDGWQKFLFPLDRLASHLPTTVLTAQQATDVKHGRRVQLNDVDIEVSGKVDVPPDLLRAYTPNHNFLAILKLANADERLWQPKKVFQTDL